jgi:hypothetical protein
MSAPILLVNQAGVNGISISKEKKKTPTRILDG